MIGLSVALIAIICVSLIRRGRQRPRAGHPDAAELAHRIRDKRQERFHR